MLLAIRTAEAPSTKLLVADKSVKMETGSKISPLIWKIKKIRNKGK